LDDGYFRRFKPLAEAMWAKDPNVIIVVGDFVYGQPIHDPFNFKGAASGRHGQCQGSGLALFGRQSRARRRSVMRQ